jgi:A49-like RNA polymerase I associated factor.
MIAAKSPPSKEKSQKDKIGKKRSTVNKARDIKEEGPIQKRVKFASTVEPAKCLTDPSSFTKELKIHVQEPDSLKDPIVVSFPSGLPLSLSDLPEDERGEQASSSSSSNPPTFTWAAARKASSKGRILYGTDDTCTYTAMNDGRGHDGRLTKLYIAIYHKPTNTVKFMPSSEKGTIFAMNQMVTNYEDAKSLDFRNLSMNERRRMVFETFGSNKKKKVLRSQDANVVEMRSVVGAGGGMMKAIKTQIDQGIISESNTQVMSDMANESETKVRDGVV